MQRIYTGPNFPKLGLFTYTRFLEDDDGNKFPPNVVAALKANPGLERYFIDFEIFAGGIPPGAAPQSAPGGSLPRTLQRGTPIRSKGGSFTIIGKK